MNLSYATDLCDAVRKNFDCGNALLNEYYPIRDEERKSCYLWSYFATTGMIYHAHKTGADVLEYYRKLIDSFKYYRSQPFADGLVKYHSERGEAPVEGHGPCFFDDNIWVARNFLFAYEVFHAPEYLQEAERIVGYTYTGWNNEIGGLVWNENGLTENGTAQELERGLSANACCILVNAKLFRLTGKESYLTWALKFYDFCKKVQDPDTKVYYNGIHTILRQGRRVSGSINRDMYSYNSGMMVLANLEMYKVTGEQDYYSDALSVANAAHHSFLRYSSTTGIAYYQDFIWFLAILAEGYFALSEYKPYAVKPWLETFEGMMQYGLKHGSMHNGLLPHDYISGWRAEDDNYDRMLLTHSGTAEIAFILSLLEIH